MAAPKLPDVDEIEEPVDVPAAVLLAVNGVP